MAQTTQAKRNGQAKRIGRKFKVASKVPAPMVLADPKGGVYTEYVALSHLKKWPRNPKKHDLPGIQKSIARFGYVAPMCIDERSGQMVAGHGRLEALVAIKEQVDKKAKDAARPKNILEKDGEWYAPVLRGQNFDSEKEAEAYLLADNRHVETGGWDDDLLRPMLLQFKEDTLALGWNARDFQLMTLSSLLSDSATSDLAKIPAAKLDGFIASPMKQIVLILNNEDYQPTLNALGMVMEKNKLKSHTDALLFLLRFYEQRSRG